MRAGISDAARRLIAEHIESVTQLDILLLLRGTCERFWTAADVARELRTSAELAEATLGRFSRSGLARVQVDADGHPCFGFKPAEPAVGAAIEELAAAYATHKTAVVALIFSGAGDSIQDFADAFRLRGGK